MFRVHFDRHSDLRVYAYLCSCQTNPTAHETCEGCVALIDPKDGKNMKWCNKGKFRVLLTRTYSDYVPLVVFVTLTYCMQESFRPSVHVHFLDVTRILRK